LPAYGVRTDQYRKTQIALAYTYWLRRTRPEVSVFWVHASNAERFRQAYTSLTQECQVPGYDDPKADVLLLVKAWLERKDRGRWLMVIDNADDMRLFFGQHMGSANASSSSHEERLGRYLPECPHGAILVTTGNMQTGLRLTKGKRPIEVGKMDESETDQLLRARLDGMSITSSESAALSSRLERLPLALVQAAAFIQENTISVGKYLELLDNSDQDLVDLLSQDFETDGRDSETPRAVAETWIRSFEQIQRQDAFAGELLSLMCLFDRQAIPSAFLSRYSKQQGQEQRGEIALTKALGILKAFSFVVEEKDHGLDMHRLVQLVTRRWLVKKGRMRHFAGQALLAVSHCYPFGRYENWALCSAYLAHVYAVMGGEGTGSRDEMAGKATLLHSVAGFFNYRGQWKDAETFQLEAVELREEVLGLEHPLTLSSMGNLASTFQKQGRWEEAEKLEVQVMETSKTKLGADHPDTLTSMANLASTFSKQGRWEEAKKLEVQVMETRRTKLGADHPETLKSMGNLASTYRKQGRWEEAEKLEVQVMGTFKTKLGADHPDTLTGMGNLALTYRDQGRWKEAESLEVQVMETRKRVLGKEHPSTLTSIANLASTFWNQGRWNEAEELQAKALDICSRVLGEEHPSTLTSMTNLATTFWNQGRWKEAEELQAKELDICSRVLGEEHPDTLTSMANLASTFWNQGRWKEAEELQAKELDICSRVLGEEHPDTLTSMANLASMYRNQGRWKEAESLAVQVMEMRKRVLGEEHPSTLASIANLATTFWNQGRWKEAEELQAKEFAMCARALGPRHPDTLISMSNLAFIWKGIGRHGDAAALIQTCFDLQQQVLGEGHPSTLSTLSTLEAWVEENEQLVV
jgi:tetratricopeptide (TPR) repeat protein